LIARRDKKEIAYFANR